MKKGVWVMVAVLALVLSLGQAPRSAAAAPQLVDQGNGIFKDVKTGLMWQMTKSKRIRSEEDALEYAKNLNLGGYHDWRLPTYEERWNLVLVFRIYLKNGKVELPDLYKKYWTKQEDGSITAAKIEVSCNCMADPEVSNGTKGYVRAVRDDKPKK